MRKLLLLLLALLAVTSASAYDPFGYDFAVENEDGVTIYYKKFINNECRVHHIQDGYSGSIKIPEKVVYDHETYIVTSISPYAFGEGITSITLPNSIKYLEQMQFCGCRDLTYINIPDSVEYIYYDAFLGSGIYNDESNWEDGVLYISDWLIKAKPSINGHYSIKEGTKGLAYQAFYCCSNLTSVKMPDSVKELGDEAFRDCDNLTSISLSSSISGIGAYCFLACKSLTSISIPNSVDRIGYVAFCGCTSLSEISFGNAVSEIHKEAFRGCSSLTSVSIPESVTFIGECAFSECGNLKEFKGKFASEDNRCLIIDGCLNSFAPAELQSYSIPNSVTSIGGSGAFSGPFSRSDLASIIIPETVVKIGGRAFEDCRKLETITVNNKNPENIELGFGVFSGVPTNTCILYVPKGSKKLYAVAEQWRDFTNIEEFGDEYTTVGLVYTYNPEDDSYTVSGYTPELPAEVIIPEEYEGKPVTKIGDEAFYSCEDLISIIIPKSITEIGREAFYDTGIFNDEANWENDVLYISEWLITAKYTLKGSYTIKDGTIGISDSAFFNCWQGLTSATIPNSVIYIGVNPFERCYKLKEFYGKYVSEDNRCIIVDGCLKAFASAELESYNIPEYVTKIGSLSFAGYNRLSTVTIPCSVQEIGKWAFNACGLTTLNLPENVVIIDDYAFFDCTKLTSVVIPNSVVSLGESSFAGCSYIKSIILPNSLKSISKASFAECISLISVNIPESVIEIGSAAFAECEGLKSVNIPSSVILIEDRVFTGCENMESIYVRNENPENIKLGNSVFDEVPVYTCILFVPQGSKELYAGADQWKDFLNIEEFEYSGVEEIVSSEKNDNLPYYNLNGVMVENPTPGIYIRGGKKVVIM